MFKGITWGFVYKVSETNKIAAALDYLNIREQQLGGYDVFVVPVYPLDTTEETYSVVYIATSECKGFLGENSYEQIADDIATSCGKIGHNIEYLFRLTDFMREYLPGEPDAHLYSIDRIVRKKIGLDEDGTECWEELLDIPIFKELVTPQRNDCKKLWRDAIKAQMRKESGIDRWSVLLLQITEMRQLKAEGVKRIDFRNSLDISGDDRSRRGGQTCIHLKN